MAMLEELQSRFPLSDNVRFDEGYGGLQRILVSTPTAEAHLYLQGAHVAHYQPAGQKPVLFVSRNSRFEPGEAIRGGVPVCFPWFGPKAGDSNAPSHGFVRSGAWDVESVESAPGSDVQVVFLFGAGPRTHPAWAHPFDLRHKVTIGTTLTMSLETLNTGPEPMTCEQALHTYFNVADVNLIRVLGLEHTDYLDKVDGHQRKHQDSQPVTIAAETDRIYLNTQATCILEDPAMRRQISVEKSGSDTTVVWNPWIEKSRALPDFGDDEWASMVCIETCTVAQHRLTLEPGALHVMTARVRSELY